MKRTTWMIAGGLAVALAVAIGLWRGRGAAPSLDTGPDAPAATPGAEPRWVARAELVVHAEPSAKGRALRRLRAGEALRVSATPERDERGEPWRAVLEADAPAGFVPEAGLHDAVVTAGSALNEARRALADARLDDALSWGEAAVALQHDLREPWDLLAAIYDVRGDTQNARRVYKAMSRLPPSRPIPPERADVAPPAAGDVRWVAATKLRVREAADAKARVLEELPLNARVEVVAVQGEFARVRWSRGEHAVWRVDLTASPPVAALVREEGGKGEGHAGWAFLAPAPASRDALLAEAAAAETAGRSEAAARALERAVALGGADAELEARLLRAATAARLYKLAAKVATRRGAAPAAADGEAANGGAADSGAADGGAATAPAGEVQLTLFFGCERDPAEAPLARCVEQVDEVGPCEPCPPVDMRNFEDEASVSAEEWAELGRQSDAAEAQHARDVSAHEKAMDEVERKVAATRADLPDGPWLQVSIAGQGEPPAGARAIPWARAFNIGGYCGNYDSQVEPPVVGPELIPWPPDGQTVELWVRVPSYVNTLYGVRQAPSAEAVRAAFTGIAGEQGGTLYLQAGQPDALGPSPNVSGDWKACLCCGC